MSLALAAHVLGWAVSSASTIEARGIVLEDCVERLPESHRAVRRMGRALALEHSASLK